MCVAAKATGYAVLVSHLCLSCFQLILQDVLKATDLLSITVVAGTQDSAWVGIQNEPLGAIVAVSLGKKNVIEFSMAEGDWVVIWMDRWLDCGRDY